MSQDRSETLHAPGDDPGLFVYWGRRGPLSRLVADLAQSIAASGRRDAVSYSPDNELAADIAAASPQAWPFPTFKSGLGAVTGLRRFLGQRRRLLSDLKAGGFRAVVVLMPHAWTPLLGRAVRRTGLRYVVVVHDARPHPGDTTSSANRWLARDADTAGLVVTLTEAVETQLIEDRPSLRGRTAVVPHPTMAYGQAAARGDGPLRVLSSAGL
ncbi:MAG: glycosyltransferase [Bauldia sp.]